MNAPLPQQQTSRLTFSGSRLNGRTGVGVGYAYMIDDDSRTALTLSVGRSGSETVVQGSVGFEFGGDRRMKIDMAEIEPAAEPEPEPEPEPELAIVYEQRQQIEQYHAEDIEVIQMEQQELESRIAALEQKPERPPQMVQAPAPEPEPEFTYEQRQAAWRVLTGGKDD
jgi:hypothetical protein